MREKTWNLKTPAGTAGSVALALVGIGVVAALATRLEPLPAGALTLLATGLGAAMLLRRRMRVYPAGARASDLPALLDRDEERRQQARWFVHMRWVAVVVSFGLILLAVPVTGILPGRALQLLAGWWLVLAGANCLLHLWVRRGSRFERQIAVQGTVDLVVLTGFLNGSGGVENPLYFAYIFHVIIAGILLPKTKAFAFTGAAALLFVLLALGEYTHALPHFTNRLFPHEGEVVGGHEHAGEEVAHAAHGGIFVVGRVLPFLTLLILSAYLTSLIAERLRRRESQLEGAGRALMLEHQRLERVVDSTGVGMMQVEPGPAVPWATGRAARWLGLDPGAAASCPLYRAAPAEGGCEVCIAEETLATGAPRESERSVRAETVGVRYFRHATSPVLDAEGRTIQVVELIEDVTGRKALEAEAIHSGKLSALGQIAAGVAHEIGNPLSSLATRLALLERRPEPEYVRESVGLLRGQIERIRRIVHGISLFARSRRQEWSIWSLNDAVRETLEVVRLDRRVRRVRIVADLAEPSPRVRGVKDQITQVLLNLLLNAAEASEEGGEVTVETAEAGARIVLTVRDRGVGIPAADRARLFEPFFSTREKGTGLGLSISYSLVNAHGGTIRVESEPGAGSAFTVELPAVAAEAGAA